MADIELTAINLLKLYEKITRHGEFTQDKYHLNDLSAYSDFDGYTLFIESVEAKVTVFFHNSFNVECKSSKDLDKFKARVEKILNNGEIASLYHQSHAYVC